MIRTTPSLFRRAAAASAAATSAARTSTTKKTLVKKNCVVPVLINGGSRPRAHVQHSQQQQLQQRRSFTFSFAGPRKLNDILKIDAVASKTDAEIKDLWYTYHESKEGVVGICLDDGNDGEVILSRAQQCPFFVQPVFRDDGFFMLLSQFQSPSHFLMAYLEDYKMDPNSASPLITFSIFNDFVSTRNISLVRVDILNKNINDQEGMKVVQSVLDNYRLDEEYASIKTFNEKPNSFDTDDYISRMNDRWKSDPPESIVDPPSQQSPSQSPPPPSQS